MPSYTYRIAVAVHLQPDRRQAKDLVADQCQQQWLGPLQGNKARGVGEQPRPLPTPYGAEEYPFLGQAKLQPPNY